MSTSICHFGHTSLIIITSVLRLTDCCYPASLYLPATSVFSVQHFNTDCKAMLTKVCFSLGSC